MTMDLLADGLLQRRLGDYAEARLTPDLATSSRLRARVLAVAHRQSALTLADAGLALVADPDPGRLMTADPRATTRATPASRPAASRLHRASAAVVAASLALAMLGGTALAARAGGPLYEARLFAETLALPADPRTRAVAELERLESRLAEAASATAAGDAGGAAAALRAYEAIVAQATAATIASSDNVASATLETGVGHNIVILQDLVATVPEEAVPAITAAIERAIARSSQTIEQIDVAPPAVTEPNGPGQGGTPDGEGNGYGPGADGGSGNDAAPAVQATPAPTKTPKPTATPKPVATPKPTATPKPVATKAPVAQPKPTAEPQPDPTPRPTRTPRPQGPPDTPPGHGRGSGDRGSPHGSARP